VYGFGQRKTPGAFVAACHKFIYLENLVAQPASAAPVPRGPAARTAAAPLTVDDDLAALLRSAVEAGSGDDGWAPLGYVGHITTQQRPDFESSGGSCRGFTRGMGAHQALIRDSPWPRPELALAGIRNSASPGMGHLRS